MSKSKALTAKIVKKMEGLNKKRRVFIISLFSTLLSFRGRHNFLNISRYGEYSEKTYRLQYEKPFDFMTFNLELIAQSQIHPRVVAFDPSFIPKSGKQTPNIDYFWSGTHGKAMKGLEIGGLALLDIKSNTALHLESIYTPDQSTLDKLDWTRIDFYANWIAQKAATLPQGVDYLCVDGYFAKKKFVSIILEKTNLHIVSKMRADANLRYKCKNTKKTGKGRKRKYGKKINLKKIDKRRLRKTAETNDEALYEGTVYSINLKRWIKMCYVARKKKGKETGQYIVLFSTDLSLSARTIFTYYKTRFQIEFLFRDAKQFTGLTHNQARSESKMNFHANAALTAINIAKETYHLSVDKSQRKAFSMADVKTENYNLFLLDFILCNSDLKHSCQKMKPLREMVRKIGKIAV